MSGAALNVLNMAWFIAFPLVCMCAGFRLSLADRAHRLGGERIVTRTTAFRFYGGSRRHHVAVSAHPVCGTWGGHSMVAPLRHVLVNLSYSTDLADPGPNQLSRPNAKYVRY
jgi:hypothetical protein